MFLEFRINTFLLLLTEESFDRLVSESLDIFLLGNVTKMLPDASN